MTQRTKVTIPYLREKKAQGKPITMLTAYDFPIADIEEEIGIDIILCGDSLGMTVYGFSGTTPVTMELMIPHSAAVKRAVPNSFKPRSERMAAPAGIMLDPGNSARLKIRSKGIAARYGRKRNNPPNLVRNCLGARSNLATSATAAGSGRVPAGRSSSRRRGSRANPSCLRMAATAGGLSGWPLWARARLMS